MTHVSICSGIGGLDIPFGVPSQFWEIADAPSQVLAARFPDVPNHGDWTQLDRFDAATTMITAGLPCQEVSNAGRRNGTDGKRYLFDDFTRILAASDCRPTLILENVRGWLSPRHNKGFRRFTRSLTAVCGYELRWGIVRASDAAAPHRRERWFCVASHPDSVAGEKAGELGSVPTRFVPTWDGERTYARHCTALLPTWGKYADAISRWETHIGRPAPFPLTEGEVPGSQVLSPVFVEWMMGFPEGWITSLDLPRTRMLQCLGNAVVPQQAALAVDLLLELFVQH